MKQSQCDLFSLEIRNSLENKNLLVNYVITNVVGRGSFGSVYHAINQFTKKEYAIKILKKDELKQKLIQIQSNIISHLQLLYQEIDIMNKYKYPLFLRLYEVIDNGENDKNIFLVEQLCDGIMSGVHQNIYSNILDKDILINKYPQMYQLTQLNVLKENYQQILIQMAQITLAIYHLHSLGLVHGDLKQANILKVQGPIYLIGDFGLTQSCENGKNFKLIISPAYQSGDDDGLTKENDIWCLGVIFFMQITGYHPAQFCSAYSYNNQIQNNETYQQMLMKYNQQIMKYTINYLTISNLLNYNQNNIQEKQNMVELLKLVFQCFQEKQDRITSKQLFDQISKQYLEYYSQYYVSEKLPQKDILNDINNFRQQFDQNNNQHVLFFINYFNYINNKEIYEKYFLSDQKDYTIFSEQYDIPEEIIQEKLSKSRQQSQKSNIQLEEKSNQSSKNSQQNQQEEQNSNNQNIKNQVIGSQNSSLQQLTTSSEIENMDSSGDDLAFSKSNCLLTNERFNQSFQKQIISETSDEKQLKDQFNLEKYQEIEEVNNFSTSCESITKITVKQSTQTQQISSYEQTQQKNSQTDSLINQLTGQQNLNFINSKDSDSDQIKQFPDIKQNNTIQSKNFPGIKIQKSDGYALLEQLGLVDNNTSESSESSVLIRGAKQNINSQKDYFLQEKATIQEKQKDQQQSEFSQDDVLASSQCSLQLNGNKKVIDDKSMSQYSDINYSIQQRKNFFLKYDEQKNIPQVKQIQQLFKNVSYEKPNLQFSYDRKQDQNKIVGLGSFSTADSKLSLTEDDETYEFDDDELIDITYDVPENENVEYLLDINDEPNYQYKDGLIQQGQARFQKINELNEDYKQDSDIIYEVENMTGEVDQQEDEPEFLQAAREYLINQQENDNKLFNQKYDNTKSTLSWSINNSSQIYNISQQNSLNEKNKNNIQQESDQRETLSMPIYIPTQNNNQSSSSDNKIKLFQTNSLLLDNQQYSSKTSSFSLEKLFQQDQDSQDIINMRQNDDFELQKSKQLSSEERILYFSYCFILFNKLWYQLKQNQDESEMTQTLVDLHQNLLNRYYILYDHNNSIQIFSKEMILDDFKQFIQQFKIDIINSKIKSNEQLLSTIKALQQIIEYISQIFDQQSAFLCQYTDWVVIQENNFMQLFKYIFDDWNNDSDKFGVNVFINTRQIIHTQQEKYHNIELFIGLKNAEEYPIVGIRHETDQRTMIIQTSDRLLDLQINQEQIQKILQSGQDLKEQDKNIFKIPNKYFQFSQQNLKIPDNKEIIIKSFPIYDLYFLYLDSMAIIPIHLLLCLPDLIINSRNYSIDKSTIRISMFNSKNYVYMIINDIGIGLQEEDTQKEYYQLQNKKLNQQDNLNSFGCGTGLKHLSMIVKKYDGIINISSNKNGGTKIIIKIKLESQLNQIK